VVADLATDADLDEVRRRDVAELGGVRPVRRMHALVHRGLGGVGVSVEVDDPELPVDMLASALASGNPTE
jgi:hypothetical protein